MSILPIADIFSASISRRGARRCGSFREIQPSALIKQRGYCRSLKSLFSDGWFSLFPLRSLFLLFTQVVWK